MERVEVRDRNFKNLRSLPPARVSDGAPAVVFADDGEPELRDVSERPERGDAGFDVRFLHPSEPP